MLKKGLCDTCENDKRCIFQSRFPVLQCEEFANSNHILAKGKLLKLKSGKCLQEVTVEE